MFLLFDCCPYGYGDEFVFGEADFLGVVFFCFVSEFSHVVYGCFFHVLW